MISRASRQTVVAWWVFFQMDGIGDGDVNPGRINRWIEYAEQNLRDCDSRLASEYEEYIPQAL